MSFEKIRMAVIYLFLWVMAFLSIFPFLWMLISATNESHDITKGKLTFGTAVIENYQKFAALFDVGQIFWNSGKIAVLGSVLTLLVSSLAGYGFEVFKSPIRERLYQGILVSMMIPFATLMIPLFILLASFDMLDTHMAVILPTVASAYMVFYFRQNTKAFPSELRDAARVDGAHSWGIFWSMTFPWT